MLLFGMTSVSFSPWYATPIPSLIQTYPGNLEELVFIILYYMWYRVHLCAIERSFSPSLLYRSWRILFKL